MWISFNSKVRTAYSEIEYPYRALSPSTGSERTYCGKSDVHAEILALYDEATKKGYELGEALYTQSLFFTSPEELIDSEMQTTIKEYSFCKTFKCPPFQSLQETPAKTVDDFLIIEQEHNMCIKKDRKKDA